MEHISGHNRGHNVLDGILLLDLWYCEPKLLPIAVKVVTMSPTEFCLWTSSNCSKGDQY